MFNESNFKKRLRVPVRGRVLVFTTSLDVEYLSENLTLSIPLYYAQGYAQYPANIGLTFMVEFRDGFLTFQEGSQVKIQEVSEFVHAHYDPQNFCFTRPADPFVYAITNVYGRYPDAQGRLYTVLVTYANPDGSSTTVEMQKLSGPATLPEWQKAFPRGSDWKGENGYPGFRIATI